MIIFKVRKTLKIKKSNIFPKKKMEVGIIRMQTIRDLNSHKSRLIYRHCGMRDQRTIKIFKIKMEQMRQVNHQVLCLIAIHFKSSHSSIWQKSWRIMNTSSLFSLERSVWCSESVRRSKWLTSYFWIIKLLRRLLSNVSKILRSGSPSRGKR